MELYLKQIMEENMKNNEKIIQKFIHASIIYGEAIESGDVKKVNSQSKIIRKIRKQLKETDELNILTPILDHENDFVKLNVAASLITISPDDSKIVLQELEKKKGLLGFEAMMFLQEWKKRNIMLMYII